jgi:hypothetical protein
MAKNRLHLAVVRSSQQYHRTNNSSNKLLKRALWLVWLPIAGLLWVIVLDTSYDWISSPSTTKVIAGSLILILMGCVIIALIATGARKLWTR